KTYGSVLWNSSDQNVAQRPAFKLRITSRCPGSSERTSSITFSMIGKNARIAAMITFDVMPKPNQITNSGTSATFGITWNVTTIGRTARSSHTSRPSTAPTTTPVTSAMPKPATDSINVVRACTVQTSGRRTSSTSAATTSSGGGNTKGETSR